MTYKELMNSKSMERESTPTKLCNGGSKYDRFDCGLSIETEMDSVN